MKKITTFIIVLLLTTLSMSGQSTVDTSMVKGDTLALSVDLYKTTAIDITILTDTLTPDFANVAVDITLLPNNFYHVKYSMTTYNRSTILDILGKEIHFYENTISYTWGGVFLIAYTYEKTIYNRRIQDNESFYMEIGDYGVIKLDYLTSVGMENTNNSKPNVNVYPNPVIDYLTIEGGTYTQIYDTNGKLLINTTEKRIDMTPYPKGMYIVIIDGIVSKKIIK